MKNNNQKQHGNPYKGHIKQIAETEKEQKLIATINNTFRHDPISEQWGAAAKAALTFTWVGNSYSLLTGSFAIGVILYTQLIGMTTPLTAAFFAVLFGGGIAFLIEFSKRKANHNYFKDVFFDSPSVGVLVLVVFLMAVSITASFYASYRLPLAASPTPNYVDVELLRMEYNTNIEELKITAKNFEDAREWKGRISSEDAKKVDQYNKDIQRLKDEKRQAIANAEKENKERWEQHEAEKTSQGYLLGYISIALELLFIFCFWAYYKYLDLCRKERTPTGATQQQINPNYTPPPSQKPSQRGIGFEYKNKDIKNEQNPVITSDNTYTQIVKTTVTHQDFKTNEVKELGAREIKMALNTYASRISKSVDALQSKGADMDTLMTLRNRLNRYQYWVTKTNELLDNYQKISNGLR